MATENTSKTVRRKDYRAPNHSIETIELTFDLVPTSTTVRSVMTVEPRADRLSDDLVLDGEDLSLEYLKINGEDVPQDRYGMKPGKLFIYNVTERTQIEIGTRINPSTNLELSGLYMSKGNYITQCEAEGFRRITYFPDRPDVLSKYKVTINAPKDYTVLLSNGNLIQQGPLPDGRNFAVWEDPYPKPSYLFALVAGHFVAQEEQIKLANGKEALLQIWTEPPNQGKTDFAMQSLIKAIRWDEEKYGLELDLERFMIVATDDFNMGAMENKGLNIFNSRCVLADSMVATDADFERIESVIGHEYFHNWTGNRVTCRDWFQLTLKEGLTVFRDQDFSADMKGNASSRAVKRIEDVRYLRNAQYPEDAGPMAHPVRPDTYNQIDNFYTTTVYEKGAEIIRMYRTLLGEEGFKKGLSEYLKRHDGGAATCDDFLSAMAEANERDLSQFARWYSQVGTPRIKAAVKWDEAAATLTLTLRQSQRHLGPGSAPEPLLIPISIGILDDQGADIPLVLEGEEAAEHPDKTRTLLLTKEEETYVFTGVKTKPLVSLGRNFSAPVIYDISYTKEQLAFLAKHDSDLFNRAEAFEKLTLIAFDQFFSEMQKKGPSGAVVPEAYLAAFEDMLNDESLSPAYRALALTFPTENYLADQRVVIEPALIREVRDQMKRKIGLRLRGILEQKAAKFDTPGEYSPNAADAGRRALRHVVLSYLASGQDPKAMQSIRRLYKSANNLTDRLAALRIAAESGLPFASDLFADAERTWRDEPLLINKWLTLKAGVRSERGEKPAVDKVRGLTTHPFYQPRNPNNIYSLLLWFFKNGGPEFHRPDGSGYQLWIDSVLSVASFNAQVAARLARSLENWRRYEPVLAGSMYKALKYVSERRNLPEAVREVVDRALTEPV